MLAAAQELLEEREENYVNEMNQLQRAMGVENRREKGRRRSL